MSSAGEAPPREADRWRLPVPVRSRLTSWPLCAAPGWSRSTCLGPARPRGVAGLGRRPRVVRPLALPRPGWAPGPAPAGPGGPRAAPRPEDDCCRGAASRPHLGPPPARAAVLSALAARRRWPCRWGARNRRWCWPAGSAGLRLASPWRPQRRPGRRAPAPPPCAAPEPGPRRSVRPSVCPGARAGPAPARLPSARGPGPARRPGTAAARAAERPRASRAQPAGAPPAPRHPAPASLGLATCAPSLCLPETT